MSCQFPQWIKDSPIIGLSVSRNFDLEGDSHKPSCGSNQLEWGGQNNQVGRSGWFFIQNNTQPNKTLLLGNNMYVNDSTLKGGDGPPLASWFECGEHIHRSDIWEQVSHVVGKTLTAIPITIAKGIKVTQVVAVNAVPPVILDTLEKLEEIQVSCGQFGQRKKLLFQQLNLSGLDKWSDRNRWLPKPC